MKTCTFLRCYPKDSLSFIHLCDVWSYTENLSKNTHVRVRLLPTKCGNAFPHPKKRLAVPMCSRPTSPLVVVNLARTPCNCDAKKDRERTRQDWEN